MFQGSKFYHAIILVVILGFVGGVGAADRLVPSQYGTIQEAINAAAQEGDTVIVADGTYRGGGNRNIYTNGKVITVRSANGAASCIIDCQGSATDEYRGFIINNGEEPNTVVQGFTIRNAYTTYQGGGIWCVDSSPTILGCVFTNNRSIYGGGIYCRNGSIRIENCTVIDNETDISGTGGYTAGGIDLNNSDGAVVSGCTIQGNISKYGGGLYCTESDATIEYCTFIGNEARIRGGGIYCSDADLLITDCKFIDNISDSSGGGICFNGGFGTMRRCDISGNMCEGSYGGGIAVMYAAEVNVENSLISGNYCPWGGGGAYTSDGTLYLRNCTICDNISEQYGSALASYDSSDVMMVNNVVWGNESGTGAGIFMGGSSNFSAINVSYCDVEGGLAGISDYSGSSAITWDVGNISTDPEYVAAGYWDDGGSAGDISDDYWVEGCYYLMPGSGALDVGDNTPVAVGETDLASNNRIENGVVDMGAYENVVTGTVSVEQLTLKAGRSRNSTDRFTITGVMDALESDFSQAESFAIRVGPYGEAISRDDFSQRGSGGQYRYRGSTGRISSAQLDFDSGEFNVSARNVDLTGMSDPVEVGIVMGDYFGYGTAVDSGVDDVINGAAAMPIQFLAGYANRLRVDKAVCREGRDGNISVLTLMGAITSAEMVDLSTIPVDLYWSESPEGHLDIVAGEFTSKGTGYMYRERPTPPDKFSGTVQIDLQRCTFKVMLKKLELIWLEGPENCRIKFGDFDEMVSVDY
ncbi:MAG: hypothetical protein JXD22_07300 [Sedimentisphaerales bacterium]|nr:hypothetical protein [Sedimentisphaerales bacterium]